MRRWPPRSTLTYTLFPYTPLFRSQLARVGVVGAAGDRGQRDRACGQARRAQAGTAEQRGKIARRDQILRPTRSGERQGDRAEVDCDRLGIDGSGLGVEPRSEEHTSELQSLMRSSYAVFCVKKKTHPTKDNTNQSTR